MTHMTVGKKYFWSRMWAALIDAFLIAIFLSFLGSFMGIFGGVDREVWKLIMMLSTFLLVAFLEFHFGATPGKSLFNLKVQDLQGHKLSYGKATLRLFLKLVVLYPLFLPLGIIVSFLAALGGSSNVIIDSQNIPIIAPSSYSTSESSRGSFSSVDSSMDAARNINDEVSTRERQIVTEKIARISFFVLIPFAFFIPLILLFKTVNNRGQALHDQFAGTTVIGTDEMRNKDSTPSQFDAIDSLQKLSELKKKGAITTAEFEEQKSRLLRQV